MVILRFLWALGAKKKPTWRNAFRRSATSAYSLMGPPAKSRAAPHLVFRFSLITLYLDAGECKRLSAWSQIPPTTGLQCVCTRVTCVQPIGLEPKADCRRAGAIEWWWPPFIAKPSPLAGQALKSIVNICILLTCGRGCALSFEVSHETVARNLAWLVCGRYRCRADIHLLALSSGRTCGRTCGRTNRTKFLMVSKSRHNRFASNELHQKQVADCDSRMSAFVRFHVRKMAGSDLLEVAGLRQVVEAAEAKQLRGIAAW